MAFPDSSKKAPNVFVDVSDSTGSPSAISRTSVTTATVVSLPPTVLPTVDFSGSPVSGYSPLTVQFTDLSTGNPIGWAWDFNNDGVIDSIERNPIWVYDSPGTYSVKLTVFNENGSNYKIKTSYIDVSLPPPPEVDFEAVPLSGTSPLTVQFTDLSTGNPTSWAWDFQNNGSVDSTQQNPTWVYSSAGSYSVKLTVSNADGSNSLTKTLYIRVRPPT